MSAMVAVAAVSVAVHHIQSITYNSMVPAMIGGCVNSVLLLTVCADCWLLRMLKSCPGVLRQL
jgi:hypothetical protein